MPVWMTADQWRQWTSPEKFFTISVNNSFGLPVIIRFRDERVRKLCEQQRQMVRKFGDPAARKLQTRLAELDSAANVTELPAGRPHELHGDQQGRYGVTVHRGLRLVLEPTQQPPPESEHGGIDWRAVDDITIVFIGDYHD